LSKTTEGLVTAIGLMSGTSMDGIDLAVIVTDGRDRVDRLGGLTVPYPQRFRQQLEAALVDARQITRREDRPGGLADVERELTQRHAAAVLSLLGERNLTPSEIDVIGFHGHTVLHQPERGLTVQIGHGEALAQSTGIDVVHDMRAADVAQGGQGAPLAPAYHRALAMRFPQRPVAVVNIGGVANITYIGAQGQIIAFDTGPGNAMIDDWMARRTGVPRDEDGRMAGIGTVRSDYVTEYLRHSYFAKPPPKSLDRNAFAVELVSGLETQDGAATLTAFAASSIAKAREHLPEEPAVWVICGGGRRNRTLMRMIAERVHNAVVPAEAAGFDGDTLEAEAWAYLAVRSLKGLPLSFPGTTGVEAPLTGGVLARA
jgi:anhydro-N-acetylmuramic acid kinase